MEVSHWLDSFQSWSHNLGQKIQSGTWDKDAVV